MALRPLGRGSPELAAKLKDSRMKSIKGILVIAAIVVGTLFILGKTGLRDKLGI